MKASENHMKALIEQNLIDFLRVTAKVSKDVCIASNEYCTYVTAAQSSWPNFVFPNQEHNYSNNDILGYDFRSVIQHQRPTFWINGSEPLRQLTEDQIQHHGFLPVVQWPLLAFDIKSNSDSINIANEWNEYTIEKGDVTDWVELAEMGFGDLQPEIFLSLFEQNEIIMLGMKKKHQWVAGMMVFIKGDVAGCYYLITHPSFRKQGLGNKMVELAMEVAVAKKCTYMVAQLSASGLPVLQKKGFQTFGLIDIFMIP